MSYKVIKFYLVIKFWGIIKSCGENNEKFLKSPKANSEIFRFFEKKCISPKLKKIKFLKIFMWKTLKDKILSKLNRKNVKKFDFFYGFLKNI